MSDSAARTARRRRRPRNGVGRRLFTPAPRSSARGRAGVERRKRSTRAMMPGGGADSPPTSIGTSVPPAHSRRMRPRSSLSSGRLTTASMRPCSRLDSERPKSSGSVSRVVSCTTRGPANESSASGSAITKSPSAANDAITPPVVGWASTETNGTPGLAQQVDGADGLGHLHEREHVLLHARAARGRDRDERDAALGRDVARAREDLADDAAHRAAHEREVHACRARTACPSIVAAPAIIASPRPVATSASLRRSVYGRRSVNASGSAERKPSAIGRKLPGSASCSTRSSAPTGKWWPHTLQTRSSSRNSSSR